MILHCLRCGHQWLRRNLKRLPKNCPGCNSPYWNRERQKKLAKRAG